MNLLDSAVLDQHTAQASRKAIYLNSLILMVFSFSELKPESKIVGDIKLEPQSFNFIIVFILFASIVVLFNFCVRSYIYFDDDWQRVTTGREKNEEFNNIIATIESKDIEKKIDTHIQILVKFEKSIDQFKALDEKTIQQFKMLLPSTNEDMDRALLDQRMMLRSEYEREWQENSVIINDLSETRRKLSHLLEILRSNIKSFRSINLIERVRIAICDITIPLIAFIAAISTFIWCRYGNIAAYFSRVSSLIVGILFEGP